MLRDERTPAARANQRVVLPIMLVMFLVLVAGLVLESEIVFGVGAVGVLLSGAAWRWV